MSSTTNNTTVSKQQLGSAKLAGQTIEKLNAGPGNFVDKMPTKSTKASAPKSSKMLDLLTRKSGCTLDELQKATGWQAHSVRGFLSGTVKKKLGFQIESVATGKGVRRYKAVKSTAT